MATRDYTGKLIVIEHPHMHNTHMIAKVVSQTPKTFMVVYWQRGWDDETFAWGITPQKRNIQVTKVIHDKASDVPDEVVEILANRIKTAKKNMEDAIMAHKQRYISTLKEIQL